MIDAKMKRGGDLTLAQLCVNILSFEREYTDRHNIDHAAARLLLKLLNRMDAD